MWSRQDLKENGKAAFKRNYGACVVVSIILGALTAASGGSSGAAKGNGNSSGVDAIRDILTNTSETTGLSVAALVALVAGMIGITVLISVIITLLVKNPFIVGCKSFFLKNSYGNASVGDVLDGFKGNYGKVVLTMFLKNLLQALGGILFVIPGIILGYSYRMVPFILAENPDMDATEVLKLSRSMMSGNKWKAFVLDLSFIGWILLSIVTCGLLAIFYTNPYMYATDAALYKAIK